MRRLLFMAVIGFAAPLSLAQERLPERTLGPDTPTPAGVRLLHPGGLLIASYDRNQDLIVSQEEIADGAKLSFAIADTDSSGNLSPIEQREWAERITDENDPAANPTVFDPNLDRTVSEDEFVEGMKRFAEKFTEGEDDLIYFDRLTATPNSERRERRPTGLDGDRPFGPGGPGRGPGQAR